MNRGHGRGLRAALGALALVFAGGCHSAGPPLPGPGAPTCVVGRSAGSAAAQPPTQQQDWLNRFARGYYPGRSGQLFLVTREGDFITGRDDHYRFMHGSPWDYDSHIPLLLHGPRHVRSAEFTIPASQQDLAPTLAALLGVSPPASTTGQVLQEALLPSIDRPRLITLLVLDGMRADYFSKQAALMPNLTQLRRKSAWFAETRINYLPTLTSVGHATIGTGTDPRFHGLAANHLFNRVTGRAQEAYDKLDPREMTALTLADVWNLATDGRAVIVAQGGAMRATAGLVGHGACLINARHVTASSYDAKSGGFETNTDCYRMAPYLAQLNTQSFWQAAGGKWLGHDVASASKIKASALFQRFEVEALLEAIAHEPFGADDVTDLLLVNMKSPDYVSHAYGPDSPEMKEELAELDRQLPRLLSAIDAKVGAGRSVLAITADHGMPSEPAPGRRYYTDDVVAWIHQRFDPDGKLVQYFNDPANYQIYIDAQRLRTLGISLDTVARELAAQPYLAAVFTEDQVRAAQVALPPR